MPLFLSPRLRREDGRRRLSTLLGSYLRAVGRRSDRRMSPKPARPSKARPTSCSPAPIREARRDQFKIVHPSSNVTMSLSPLASSTQASPWRPRPTTYGCFLSDLTGFAAARRTGPEHRYRSASQVPMAIALGREFDPAKADCGYRAPLVPRLARPIPLYAAAEALVKRSHPPGSKANRSR